MWFKKEKSPEKKKHTVMQQVYGDLAAAQVNEIIRALDRGALKPVSNEDLHYINMGLERADRYFTEKRNCDPFFVKVQGQWLVFDKTPWGAVEGTGKVESNLPYRNPIENPLPRLRSFPAAQMLHSMVRKDNLKVFGGEKPAGYTTISLQGKEYHFDLSKVKHKTEA